MRHMHQTSSRELVLQRRARPGQRHRVWKWLWGTLLAITGTSVLAGEPNHGFAYFGELKYPADMAHFDYVNPQTAYTKALIAAAFQMTAEPAA
jgi:microcin C transport system substrate-binding protein